MKGIVVATSMLVILSLASPALALNPWQTVPQPDPDQDAGETVADLGAAAQRLVDDIGGSAGSDGGDGGEEEGSGPSTDGAPTSHGIDPEAALCGKVQFVLDHDCPEAEQPDPSTGAPDADEDGDAVWRILDGQAVGPNPEVPAIPDAAQEANALVTALSALLRPVQHAAFEAGQAAGRMVTQTFQTTTFIVGQATQVAEAQVAALQEHGVQLLDKFMGLVPGQSGGPTAGEAQSAQLQADGTATPVTTRAATTLALAAAGGVGLLVGGFAILRRLLGLGGVSLLSRIPSKDIMKNDTRAAIFDIVTSDPGVSLNEIVGRLGISRNAVAYHLAVFESEKTVVSVKDGKYRRYFVNGGKYVNGAKDVVSTIKNDVTLDVIRYILDNPGAIQKQVCEAVGTSPSATNWHIHRLEKVGLVAKEKVANTVRYSPGPSFQKYDLAEFGLQTASPVPA